MTLFAKSAFAAVGVAYLVINVVWVFTSSILMYVSSTIAISKFDTSKYCTALYV